jgi:imidazoleglycerol-phosphate dehydratase
MTDAIIERNTKETKIILKLSSDGEISVDTGIGFFDHMLGSFALHGGFGLFLKVEGDLSVDPHHTVEDTGIALGQAFKEAVGDKRGIARFADCHIPMDEALAFAAVDVSGRPYLAFDAEFKQEKIGAYDSCLTAEFMRGFVMNAGITLHLRLICGENAHHATEALFKAAARALKSALTVVGNEIPSAKGVL